MSLLALVIERFVLVHQHLYCIMFHLVLVFASLFFVPSLLSGISRQITLDDYSAGVFLEDGPSPGR